MCINSLTGETKWKIPFGTRINPVVSNRFIFLISKDGFILNIDKTNGEVVWSKKLLSGEDLNKKKIGDVFSLFLLSDQIFFSTKNGYFFFVNYKNGEIENYAKVAKGFYSKPTVSNGKIYLIDKSMKLLIFN